MIKKSNLLKRLLKAIMSSRASFVKALKNLNQSYKKLTFGYKSLVWTAVFLIFLGVLSSRTVLEPPSLKMGDNLKGSLQLAGRTLETFSAADVERISANTLACAEKTSKSHLLVAKEVITVEELLLTQLKEVPADVGYIFITVEPNVFEDAFSRKVIADSDKYFKASRFFENEIAAGDITTAITNQSFLLPGQILFVIFSKDVSACAVSAADANKVQVASSGFTLGFLSGADIIKQENADNIGYDELNIKKIWRTNLFASRELLLSGDVNLSPDFYWVYADYNSTPAELEVLKNTDTDLDGVSDANDLCDGIDEARVPDDFEPTASGAEVDNVGCSLEQAGEDLDGDDIRDAVDDDRDNDGVLNDDDAFPDDPDESEDTDGDEIGDEADTDDDDDGSLDDDDNCPEVPNADQLNTDGDEHGNACDDDDDNDGFLDADELGACATDPLNAASVPTDLDEDDICDELDNDRDNDGVLNADDAFPDDETESADTDGDGVGDNSDNCPDVPNVDQANIDADEPGDACDNDIDNDGVINEEDAFPDDETESVDTDGDGLGDEADTDDDGDGILDDDDNCPDDENADQLDIDGDGLGDVCDNANDDNDADGVADADDNCPAVFNPLQGDYDVDADGDACDNDIDNDGVEDIVAGVDGAVDTVQDYCPTSPLETEEANRFYVHGCLDEDNDSFYANDIPLREFLNADPGVSLDNCPAVANDDQVDTDADGLGDACGDFNASYTLDITVPDVSLACTVVSMGKFVVDVSANNGERGLDGLSLSIRSLAFTPDAANLPYLNERLALLKFSLKQEGDEKAVGTYNSETEKFEFVFGEALEVDTFNEGGESQHEFDLFFELNLDDLDDVDVDVDEGFWLLDTDAIKLDLSLEHSRIESTLIASPLEADALPTAITLASETYFQLAENQENGCTELNPISLVNLVPDDHASCTGNTFKAYGYTITNLVTRPISLDKTLFEDMLLVVDPISPIQFTLEQDNVESIFAPPAEDGKINLAEAGEATLTLNYTFDQGDVNQLEGLITPQTKFKVGASPARHVDQALQISEGRCGDIPENFAYENLSNKACLALNPLEELAGTRNVRNLGAFNNLRQFLFLGDEELESDFNFNDLTYVPVKSMITEYSGEQEQEQANLGPVYNIFETNTAYATDLPLGLDPTLNNFEFTPSILRTFNSSQHLSVDHQKCMKSGDDLSLEIAGDYISPKLTPVSGYIEFSYGYGFTGRNASYKSRKLFFNNFLNDAYISRTDYDPEGGDLTLKIPTYLNMPETVDVEVFTKESSGHAPLTTHENVEVTAVHGRAVHRRSFLTFNVGRSVGIDIAVLMGIFFEDENKQLLKNDVVLIGDEDSDGDGIEDWLDNCPFVANPQQQNSDIISYNGLTYSDGFGDACDDSDDDGYLHNDDNCPNTTNPNQDDFDGDELGDVCDYDDDDDGVLDTLDICPFTNSWNKEKVISVDAILDACGPNALNNVNCPNFYYRHAVDYQGCYDEDTDGVPYEDWYDSDDDGSFDNSLQIDNCPDVHNPLQFDWNEDGVGFACDADGRAAYQHYRDAEASYYEQQGQRSPQDQEYGQGGQGGSDYNDSDSQETDDGEFVFDGNPDTNGGQAGGWDDQAFELQLESDKEGGGFGLDLPDKEGFGLNLESDVKLEWGRSY